VRSNSTVGLLAVSKQKSQSLTPLTPQREQIKST
jgi:hypothetical protein